MSSQVPLPHLRPSQRPISQVPLPPYAQPPPPAPQFETPVPLHTQFGTPAHSYAQSGMPAPSHDSRAGSPRPGVRLMTPRQRTQENSDASHSHGSRVGSPRPGGRRMPPVYPRERTQENRATSQPGPPKPQVKPQMKPQVQASTQVASAQAPASASAQRQAQSEAPAHPPSKPGFKIKLMALNSSIMAAQRQWDQVNPGPPSSGSISHSDSGASTASDIPNIRPTRALPSTSSTAEPVVGQKRSLNSSTVATSSRPIKRTYSESFAAPPQSLSSSLPASQPMTSSRAQRRAQTGPIRPKLEECEWLKFNALDSVATRADGVPYECYRGFKSKLETMPGALFPTNYRLDTSSPFPFVCPDKDCGKAFDSSRSLVGHFSAAHKGCAYNDNCDGSFSKVGHYKRASGESWRAIVVSQVSVTGSTEEEDVQTEGSPAPFTEAHVALTSPDPFTYVSSFLPHHVDRNQYLATPYIQELCKLPKRRPLPASWISFHRNTVLSERMFGLAVAYITGRGIFGIDTCKETLHKPNGRLSRECIAVPFELSHELKKVCFPGSSCIACYYYNEVNEILCRCSWLSGNGAFLDRYRKRVDGLEDGDDDYDGVYAHPGTEIEVSEQRRRARAVEAVIEAGKAPLWNIPQPETRSRLSRSSKLGRESAESSSTQTSSADDPSSPIQELEPVSGQSPTNAGPASRPRRQAQTYRLSGRTRSAAASKRATDSLSPEPTTKPCHPVQAMPPQFEMESWEVAPGRITDPAHGENIGYSNAYLNGREPVKVSEDVSFNVVTVKPGDNARWKAHESELRTCSVASGKVEVKIGTRKFGTGPNSIFIIRPGETCVATNKLYNDATIHCTTVKNYSLS